MTPVTQTISPTADTLATADGMTDKAVRIRPITPVFGAFLENLQVDLASLIWRSGLGRGDGVIEQRVEVISAGSEGRFEDRPGLEG